MIERCMCGYPPIILVHLSVGARAFSIILSGAHHQQNNIMLWINQSLIYVLSQEKNTKWNRNRFRSYIQFLLFLLLLMLCFIKNTLNQVTSWVGWSAFGLFCANCLLSIQTTNILDQLAQAFRQIIYSLKLVVFVLPFFLLLYESFSHFYVVSIGGEGDEMGN